MKNSTINYVFRKVLIFFIIYIILSFIRSCNVHAKTYSLENQSTYVAFYPSTQRQVINWNQLYYLSANDQSLYQWQFQVEILPTTLETSVLYAGRYLVEMYIFGVGEFSDLSCDNLSSNFSNVNMTTGAWVSNEITSSCIGVYKTTYKGYTAQRMLFEFTYKGDNYSSSSAINEIRFYVGSGNGSISSFSTGMNYGVNIGNIVDYDINIINTWNTDKQQQTIINQQNQNTQSIINNQDSNTQDIINNQNSNTSSITNGINSATQQAIDNANQIRQDIINNQNANTQQQIESQLSCTNLDKNNIITRGLLSSDGSIRLPDSNSYGISDYIKLNNGTLEVLTPMNYPTIYTCFYTSNKSLISCAPTSSVGSVTIPQNAIYFRSSFYINGNQPIIKFCKNGNQALVDSLTDDSSPSLDALNNSAGWLPPGPVDSILNLPLSLLNNLTTNLSKSCQSVILPIPYLNQNLTLPCVYSLYEQMGITIWVGLVGTIASAFILFSYLAKLYKWVDDTLTFRENNNIDNWGGI